MGLLTLNDQNAVNYFPNQLIFLSVQMQCRIELSSEINVYIPIDVTNAHIRFKRAAITDVTEGADHYLSGGRGREGGCPKFWDGSLHFFDPTPADSEQIC